MRIDGAYYGLPMVLREHFEWMRTHRPLVIEPKIPPTLPVRIPGEVFDVVYTQGPLLKSKLVPGTGRLLGVA